LVLLIAYMCPYSLEINIRSSFFLHFWQGDSRKSQDLAWAACSVPRKWIKWQQTASSAGCKVLTPSAGFLLASMPSYCRLRPIECCYSQSVSVSVPQDKIWGSAINRPDNVDSPIDRGPFHQPLQLLSVLCRSQLVQASLESTKSVSHCRVERIHGCAKFGGAAGAQPRRRRRANAR